MQMDNPKVLRKISQCPSPNISQLRTNPHSLPFPQILLPVTNVTPFIHHNTHPITAQLSWIALLAERLSVPLAHFVHINQLAPSVLLTTIGVSPIRILSPTSTDPQKNIKICNQYYCAFSSSYPSNNCVNYRRLRPSNRSQSFIPHNSHPHTPSSQPTSPSSPLLFLRKHGNTLTPSVLKTLSAREYAHKPFSP